MTRRRPLGPINKVFGVDPHGPLWIAVLPSGRYQAGCRQCGCSETSTDAGVIRLFLRGHRAGMDLVKAVNGA